MAPEGRGDGGDVDDDDTAGQEGDAETTGTLDAEAVALAIGWKGGRKTVYRTLFDTRQKIKRGEKLEPGLNLPEPDRGRGRAVGWSPAIIERFRQQKLKREADGEASRRRRQGAQSLLVTDVRVDDVIELDGGRRMYVRDRLEYTSGVRLLLAPRPRSAGEWTDPIDKGARLITYRDGQTGTAS